MKKLTLTRECLRNPQDWPKDYRLPNFDIDTMIKRTKDAPIWLHIGAGNIFRIFVAGLQQDLLESGQADKGIIVYESYDEGIIPASYTPYDNLTLAVSLNADGSVGKRVIASIADVFHMDLPRLMQTIAQPSLQIISFTITEKGYAVPLENICLSPDTAKTAMEQVTAGLFARFQAGGPPLALVTMDNFAENGTVVARAVEAIATAWHTRNHTPAAFIEYVKSQSYPWTMIDKITPMPSKTVADILAKDGYASTQITETAKHTTVASFVNAESPQYLVIEDCFPNGRPPLEKTVGKGVFFTNRDTVRKADQMKVCACLNPLHTILGVCGALFNYPTISSCMQDRRLVGFIKESADEAMSVVADPGIINPHEFLHEVVTQRFPNPFIPDTTARINMDASQKISIRFGETLKSRLAAGLDTDELKAIPLFIALWLRFRMGIDDNGAAMALSPDPKVPEAVLSLLEMKLGESADLRPILSNKEIFGLDLCTAIPKLAAKVENLFQMLSEKPGVVNKYLTACYGEK